MRQIASILPTLTCVLVLSGCIMHGAKMNISARDAAFAISMTESFYDKHGRLLMKEHYQRVHHFALDYSKTSFSLGCAPRNVDLGPTLLPVLRKYSGDAVVNVKITADSDFPLEMALTPLNLLVGLPTLGLFGFGNVTARIEGDIVRVTGRPTVPALKESPSDERIRATNIAPK